MRKNYFFALLFLLLQATLYGQDHTHVYSRIIGGNAWQFPVNELGNLTHCQSGASLTVNGFNWAGWSVGYSVEVNGEVIATDLDGQFTYDLADYLPVQSVKMLCTDGGGWIEMHATLTITAHAEDMPDAPVVSNLNFPYGVTAPLTATLTGSGTTLKFYTMQDGDVAPINAAAPTMTPGTTTYWVSQADASGCESVRIPMQVTVAAPENIVHVSDNQCGTMLQNVSSQVMANLVANAQGYRFRVTDLYNGQVAEKDTNIRAVQLCNLPNFNYGHQYSIQVAVKRNGNWSGFGLPCDVYTPMAFTKIRNSQCGMTVSRNEMLYADLVPYVKGYAFMVTNLMTGESQTIESATRSFSFGKVMNFMPGVNYSIQVAVRNNEGTYQPFGEECIVIAAGTYGGELFRTAAAKVDAEAAFGVAAFPNPFVDAFRLAVQGNDSDIEVKIYDMAGRLVESGTVSRAELENSTFGSAVTGGGIYSVVVTQGNNTQTMKMIKR